MGKNRSMEFLHRLFLEDPETGDRMRIVHVESEEGSDHITIISRGGERAREDGTAWKFRVYVSETSWPPVKYPPGIFESTELVLSEIRQECIEQVTDRGYDAEHDDGHTTGDLARIACYLAYPAEEVGSRVGTTPVSVLFPPGFDIDSHRYRQHDRRTCLKKAAALLVKEIQRLDRRAAKDA